MVKIKALYKEYDADGDESYTERQFGSWQEEGSYTIFYSSYALDTAELIIPTRYVKWIELIK